MNQKPVICRFCRTDLRLKYFPKAPTCNVSAKLENKDLLNLHQNKDVIYVVIADCLIDLGKPLDIKASIPSKSCLICIGSVVRLHAQLISLLENLNLDAQLNLSSKKKSKVNFSVFDCFSEEKVSEKPNQVTSSIKDSPTN